eukprot:153047-Chlamydomonas_euryale.AAC.16
MDRDLRQTVRAAPAFPNTSCAKPRLCLHFMRAAPAFPDTVCVQFAVASVSAVEPAQGPLQPGVAAADGAVAHVPHGRLRICAVAQHRCVGAHEVR